jgi:hypothetical protein
MTFANCRQNQPRSTALQCVCGGQGGGDVRLVRMRVPSKATTYSQNVVALCVTCRRAERGRWMYVDRAGYFPWRC